MSASSKPGGDVAAVLSRNDLTADQLILAVRAAAAGLRVDAKVEEQPPPILDDHRMETLRLLAAGADTRTIAGKLHCSERTAKTYVGDIKVALGARTRAQAVAEAVRLGLL